MDRIRATTAKSDKIVYPPLSSDWEDDVEYSRHAQNRTAERALNIPGVKEAGWTLSDLVTMSRGSKDADLKKHQLKTELLALVNKVSDQQFSWCFRDPVNTEEVTDYLDTVTEPIDLKTIEKRIRKGDWYKNKHMLYSDLMKMVNNCKLYNGEGSTYTEHAISLEKYLSTIFPKRLMTSNNI
jgi:histone acetyltransferase